MTYDKIEPNEWYKPREIIKNGWIKSTGTSEGSHYNFILREIKAGNLKADNYARGPKDFAYYRVLGEWIIEYLKNQGVI